MVVACLVFKEMTNFSPERLYHSMSASAGRAPVSLHPYQRLVAPLSFTLVLSVGTRGPRISLMASDSCRRAGAPFRLHFLGWLMMLNVVSLCVFAILFSDTFLRAFCSPSNWLACLPMVGF